MSLNMDTFFQTCKDKYLLVLFIYPQGVWYQKLYLNPYADGG